MHNYVAIVFESNDNAFDGLHALWECDARGDLTVQGAVVVSRDEWGHIDPNTPVQDTTGAGTAVGIGIGLLLGALALPIVAAAGASIAVGEALGLGAMVGAAGGVAADARRLDQHDQVKLEASLVIPNGSSAIIADVREDSPGAIDALAATYGGKVFRRAKSDVAKDARFSVDFGDYLYPYDYQPKPA